VRTAIFSTYPPRACGIGTFAFDVRTALLGVPEVEDCSALVVVDDPSSPQRPEILQTISQGARRDYVRAARTLGRLDIDVVLLQHEYGIFGGQDGTYALSFARELAQPLVVTLHTVLSSPTEHQFQVLTALCNEAERVIVMTETARRMIIELGVCDDEKLRVIPHGAPVALGAARAELAAGRRPRYVAPSPGGYEWIDSRFLLSSFGLLSPGKGLETMIDALPAIVERHPETLYLIAGRTHPQIARRHGEEYRFMLERRILDLGLDDHAAPGHVIRAAGLNRWPRLLRQGREDGPRRRLGGGIGHERPDRLRDRAPRQPACQRRLRGREAAVRRPGDRDGRQR